jgi:hypothetical protein
MGLFLQMIALTASKYQLNHFPKFAYLVGWGKSEFVSKFCMIGPTVELFAPYYQHHFLLPHKIRVYLWLLSKNMLAKLTSYEKNGMA